MKLGSIDTSKFEGLLHKVPERFGLYVDNESVRIVRLKKDEHGSYRLAAFGELDLDLKNLDPMQQQRFGSALNQLSAGNKCVAVNIEHSSLRIRKMNFAKMPEKDLLEAIKWNFREQIEGEMDDYLVSYTPLDGHSDGNKTAYMAYGVSALAVRQLAGFLKTFGLKTVSVEPISTALLASMYINDILKDGGVHVCIFFGEANTQFAVMHDCSLLFSRPLANISHDFLVQLIMRNFNMPQAEAKKAMNEWVVRDDAQKDIRPENEETEEQRQRREKITTTASHFLSQLFIEVQRSLDAYSIMYNADKVDDIYICGMGALYPGLVEQLKKTIGVDTKIFDPFEKIADDSLKTQINKLRAPLFAVSVGLALP